MRRIVEFLKPTIANLVDLAVPSEFRQESQAKAKEDEGMRSFETLYIKSDVPVVGSFALNPVKKCR